jgi:xanthine dehydrogenase accessory factor
MGQTPHAQELLAAISSALADGSAGALITIVDGPGPIGAKLFVRNDGPGAGTLSRRALDSVAAHYARKFLESRFDVKTITWAEITPNRGRFNEVRFLFERIAPKPRLIVCGAGHVGAALARLGSSMGFSTNLIDDRAELLNPEGFVGLEVELTKIARWSTGIREVVGNGRGAYVAIVTRGHREDEECLHAVLSSKPDYVGMIGSRRRTDIVLNRLRKAGFWDETLAVVRAPIGLDIGAVSPEEVALAVIAEIVMERRGGTGAPLSAWRRAKS